MSSPEEKISAGAQQAAPAGKFPFLSSASLMRFIRFCIVGGLATVVDLGICFCRILTLVERWFILQTFLC